jgi:hypothetical protein
MREIAGARLIDAVFGIVLLGERDLDLGIALERGDDRIAQRFGFFWLAEHGTWLGIDIRAPCGFRRVAPADGSLVADGWPGRGRRPRLVEQREYRRSGPWTLCRGLYRRCGFASGIVCRGG